MMRYGNFSELIKAKYDNVIFEALSDFVSEKPHLIESECDNIASMSWTADTIENIEF